MPAAIHGKVALKVLPAEATKSPDNIHLNGHRQQVRYLAFSPDGRHIASGSVDHTVKVWDLETSLSKNRISQRTTIRAKVVP